MTRVIVAGGRGFKESTKTRVWLLEKLADINPDQEICGCSQGADLFGAEMAKILGISIKFFAADWNGQGKAAGPIRNKKMAEHAALADQGICILFPGGNGTKNMKEEAQKVGLEIIEYQEEET